MQPLVILALHAYNNCVGGKWRSLVAHLFWVQGVGGSNPLFPTTH